MDKNKTGLEMKYFVLKPRGSDIYALASRKAMQTFANVVMPMNSKLASDLLEWIGQEHVNAYLRDTPPGQRMTDLRRSR